MRIYQYYRAHMLNSSQNLVSSVHNLSSIVSVQHNFLSLSNICLFSMMGHDAAPSLIKSFNEVSADITSPSAVWSFLQPYSVIIITCCIQKQLYNGSLCWISSNTNVRATNVALGVTIWDWFS